MPSLFIMVLIVVGIALVGAIIAIWTTDLEEEHKEEVAVGEHLRTQKQAIDVVHQTVHPHEAASPSDPSKDLL